MSERKIENYPAFPAPGLDMGHPLSGITMRQYYKASALKGLLANGPLLSSLNEVAEKERVSKTDALMAFVREAADAMLAEDEEHAKK